MRDPKEREWWDLRYLRQIPYTRVNPDYRKFVVAPLWDPMEYRAQLFMGKVIEMSE